VRFYQDVLGMRVVWQPDADNVYPVERRDNLALHRARGASAGGASPLDHLGFLVESPERCSRPAKRSSAPASRYAEAEASSRRAAAHST